jgi:hypothetical protein
LCGDLTDVHAHILGHVADDGEDDDAGKDGSQEIANGNDHCIPAQIVQQLIYTKKIFLNDGEAKVYLINYNYNCLHDSEYYKIISARDGSEILYGPL